MHKIKVSEPYKNRRIIDVHRSHEIKFHKLQNGNRAKIITIR